MRIYDSHPAIYLKCYIVVPNASCIKTKIWLIILTSHFVKLDLYAYSFLNIHTLTHLELETYKPLISFKYTRMYTRMPLNTSIIYCCHSTHHGECVGMMSTKGKFIPNLNSLISYYTLLLMRRKKGPGSVSGNSFSFQLPQYLFQLIQGG